MSVWSVKEADADQFRIMFAGVPISRGAGQSGYADGEFLTVEPARASFTSYEGTDGSITWSKTNSRLLKIALTLAQTAASNAILSAQLFVDEVAGGGKGIGSFVVQDQQGTTLLACARARIVQRPNFALDRTPKERKWLLEAIWEVYLVGGN